VGALLLRVRLFFSSYAPLFALLALRFEDKPLRIACALLAGGGVLTLAFLLHALKKKNATPYKIERVADQGPEVAGYIASYLSPFVLSTKPSVWDLIAYALFLLVVGVVYVRSNMVQVNPLLYVLSYRVVEVTTSDDWNGYLISRRKPSVGDQVLVSRFVNTLALERSDDQRVAGRPGSGPD